MARDGLFANSLHRWLEANGVVIGDPVPVPASEYNPSGMAFSSMIDLNTLKVGIAHLIRAAGGDVGSLPEFEDEAPVAFILIPSETGPDSGPTWQWPVERDDQPGQP